MSRKADPLCAPREALPWLRDEVARLSRCGGRLGTGPIALREVGGDAAWAEVVIEGAAPRLAGYRIVATLHHRDGATEVEAVPGEPLDDERWSRAEPWCEHCGLRRERRVTYVLRRGGGAPVQVGSSCLADFTGERDPVRAVRQAAVLASARSAVEVAMGREGPEPPAGALPTAAFLAQVARAAREAGFVSRSAAGRGRPPSAEAAWERALRGKAATPADRALAREVVRWGRDELAARHRRSSYEDRLTRALSRPRVRERERYLLASALRAHARERAGPYVGAVGERVALAVTVEGVAREPVRGRFGPAYLHRLRDELGRLVVWYATARRLERGRGFRLRATVRRRGHLGSEPASVVHRCRVQEFA